MPMGGQRLAGAELRPGRTALTARARGQDRDSPSPIGGGADGARQGRSRAHVCVTVVAGGRASPD